MHLHLDYRDDITGVSISKAVAAGRERMAMDVCKWQRQSFYIYIYTYIISFIWV